MQLHHSGAAYTTLGKEDQRSKSHWVKFTFHIVCLPDPGYREQFCPRHFQHDSLLIKAWSVDINIQSFDFARPFKAEMRGDQACVASPVSCSASHQLTVPDTSETAKGPVLLQASNPQLAAAMPQTKVLEVQADFKIKLTGLLGSLICSQTVLNKITFLCP